MNTKQLTLGRQTQEFSVSIYKTKSKIRGLARQKVNTVTKLEIKTTSEMYMCQTFLLIILEEKCYYTISNIHQWLKMKAKSWHFLKNAKFVGKPKEEIKIPLHVTHKERNRFNINTKRLRCNPQCLEKTALEKPNVYYSHSQTVELVLPLCRVMGCNGHPA